MRWTFHLSRILLPLLLLGQMLLAPLALAEEPPTGTLVPTPGSIAGPGETLSLTVTSAQAVSWSGPEWKATGDAVWQTAALSGTAVPNTPFTVSWVVPVTPGQYQIRVKLTNAQNVTGYSAVLALDLPAAPVVTATDGEQGNTLLAWTAGSGTAFDVLRSTDPGLPREKTEVLATQTPATTWNVTYNSTQNGSFEQGQDAANQPLGWAVRGTGSFALDPSAARWGSTSLQLTRSTAAGSYEAAQTVLRGPELAGKPLTFSGWLKAENLSGNNASSGAAIVVQFTDRAGNVLMSASSAPLQGTFDWQQVFATGWAPANTWEAVVMVRLEGATGSLWADGIQVEPATDASRAFSPESWVRTQSFYRVIARKGPLYGSPSSAVSLTPAGIPQQIADESADMTPDARFASVNLLTENQSDAENDTTGFYPLGATLGKDMAEAWSGANSLRVTTQGGATGQGFYVWTATTPGSTYTFSVYLKGTGQVRLRVSAGGNGRQVATGPTITLTSRWTRYAITATADEGTAYTNFIVDTPSAQAITFYADGLQAEHTAQVTLNEQRAQPGNLLTETQAEVEAGTAGFNAYHGATLARDPTTAQSGVASLRVTAPGVAAHEGFYVAPATTAVTPYTFSVFLKGTGTVHLRVSGGGTGQTLATGPDILLTDTWTRYAITAVSHWGTGYTNFIVETPVAGAATFYADTLRVEQTVFATANILSDYQADVEVSGPPNFSSLNATIQRDETTAWHGKASLRVTTAGGAAGQGFYVPPATIPGRPYAFSVYLKGSGTVRLRVSAGGTGRWLSTGPDIALTDTWTRYGIVGVADAGATFTNFIVDTPSAQSVTFFADGLLVQEAVTASNNLLTENQFGVETDTTGFTASGSAVLTRDSTVAWQGNSALKVVTAGGADREGTFVDAKTGAHTSYTFSVYLKGTGTLRLRVTGAGAGTELARGPNITLTDTWTRHAITATAQPGTTATHFIVETPSAQSITFYADGLQVVQNHGPAPWTLGGTGSYRTSCSSANVLSENQSSAETDTSGFQTLSSWNINSGAILSRVSDAWHGSHALQVTTDGSAASQGVETVPIPAYPNTVYTASAWIKAPPGTALRLRTRDHTNTVSAPDVTVIGDGTWQRYDTTLTTGAMAVADLRMAVGIDGSSAATFLVDGLQIEPGSYATPWIPGGTSSGAAACPTANLLTANQSSIETDLTGFRTAASWNVNPGATLTRVSNSARFGNALLRVETNGSTIYQGVETAPIPFSANTVYTASVWVKAPPGASLQLFLRDHSNLLSAPWIPITGDGNWHRYSTSFVTGASSGGDLRMGVRVNGSATVTYELDGLQIEKNRFATPWILGGTSHYSAGAATVNLLSRNQSSIEVGTTGFATAASWNINPGALISRVVTEQKFGGAALKVEPNTASASQGVETTPIPLAANQVYTASAWVKAPVGTTLQLFLRDHSNLVSAPYTTFTADGTWQRYSTTLTTGASDGADMRMGVRVQGTGSVTYYVDGLQIEPGHYPRPWAMGN